MWGRRRKNGVGGVDCLTGFLYNWGLGWVELGQGFGSGFVAGFIGLDLDL